MASVSDPPKIPNLAGAAIGGGKEWAKFKNNYDLIYFRNHVTVLIKTTLNLSNEWDWPKHLELLVFIVLVGYYLLLLALLLSIGG